MPQINLPDWGSDGAGDVSSQTAPITASVSELPSSLGQPMTEMPANLEMCQSTIAQAANAISQQPILIEDTSDRRVAVFKFIDGDLTVTCADGSMRMERRP